MKKWFAASLTLLVLAFELKAQLVTVNNFDDIQFWAGSGENRSVLVLQFSASQQPVSIAWGYRWSGSATAALMIFALAGNITGSGMPAPVSGADPRLSVDGSFFPSFGGYFLNSLTYNQTGLPIPWSQSLRTIEDNWFVDETYPSLYTQSGNGIWNGNPFSAAQVGISDINLSNGGWVAFAQTDGTDPLVFNQPVSAVPEPGSLALIAAGGLLLTFWRSSTLRRTRKKLAE
jgi:hypothetical protein